MTLEILHDGTGPRRVPPPRRRPACVTRTSGPMPDGRRAVALVADIENLSLSARDAGCVLDYDRFASIFGGACPVVEGHAFFSRHADDDRLCDRLARGGWLVHPRTIVTVRTPRGPKRLANSDHTIAFGAGVLAMQARFDTVILATGDGALGCDLASAIRSLRKDIGIYTASISGSTSRRLQARVNPDIDGNIEIGLDAMEPPLAPHVPVSTPLRRKWFIPAFLHVRP